MGEMQYLIKKSTLTGIADEYRSLLGTADKFTPENMKSRAKDVYDRGYEKGYEAGTAAAPDVPGEGGECSGDHVIIVDELPSENIDENAVYQCGGAYYTGAFGFHDLISVYGGTAESVKNAGFEEVSFNIIGEQTTEGILTSDLDAYVFHFYYIESEKNVFVYDGEGWVAFGDFFGIPFLGKIADVNEINTDSEGVYALIGPQWTQFNSETVDVDELPKIGVEGAVYNITKCIGTAFVMIGSVNTITTYDNGVACFEATSENYEDIAVPEGMNTALCYVTDIPDIYVYDTGEWMPLSALYRELVDMEVPFLGEIRYQAAVNTEKNGYYACIVRELYRYSGGEFERLISEAEAAVTANELFVTPTEGVQEFTPPDGAYYSHVTVEAIPNGYVKPSGGKNITANGTHDVTNVKEAIVNVPIPEGYVKPEGALTVTENVTDMDITDKKTLTVYVEESSLMNIAYGDTPPEDTSKLWVKTEAPQSMNVKLSPDYSGDVEILNTIAELPYDTGVISMASASVGTKAYIFGGYHTGGGGTNGEYNRLNTILAFDTTDNSITTLITTLPDRTTATSAVAVGDKIYLFGGYTVSYNYAGVVTAVYLNKIQVFDTTDNSRTTLSKTLPTGMHHIQSAAVGDKIYLFGGCDRYDYYDTIQVFDTSDNSLITLDTKLPTVTIGSSIAAVGDKIYLFGGKKMDSKDAEAYLDEIRVFDTTNNSITTLNTRMPFGISATSAAAVGDNIYVFGGSNYDTSYHNRIYVFNVKTNDLIESSRRLPTSVNSTSSAAVGNKIYMFGGEPPANYSGIYLKEIHALDTAEYVVLPENNVVIEISTEDNIFNILPTVEIGVENVYLGNADGKGERVVAALYKDGTWVNINSGTAIIAFTINNAPYYADKGMLWWEWIESDYNPDSRYIRMESEIWDTQDSKYVCLSDGSYVASAAEIESGDVYTLGS